ncbi:TerB family tellurite resistance protein [Biformimicrobium ophioploci]|uniref:Co-chaperone DjlA N-terminal domain-containing protein n=1 Tax=Biformimicrobium ophioploci TaxID=3036711 RepID=A0ABQ6M037_9GAMM|nr:TerB family tellurite resistance protein [Microbulbifer sp. NKW57]GMG87704.1 hypothetical protein MNKW57_20250 [Microbulbifer sp. NKW57]
MGIINVESFKALFNTEVTAEQKREAFRDILLLVLARGSRVDLHTHDAEIKVTQKVFLEYMDEEVTAGEIRVAASSELYEKSSINKHVARAAKKLDYSDRILVINALRDVLRADGHVRKSETDFFDEMATVMQLRPSDIAGIPAPAQ